MQGFDSLIESGEDIQYVALIQDANINCVICLPKGHPSIKFAITAQECLTIQNIRDGLHINDNQQVLLSFAWISGREREMLSKFPKLIVFDVTKKTFKEK